MKIVGQNVLCEILPAKSYERGEKIEFIVCTIIRMDFPNFKVEFFYDVEIGLYKEF